MEFLLAKDHIIIFIPIFDFYKLFGHLSNFQLKYTINEGPPAFRDIFVEKTCISWIFLPRTRAFKLVFFRKFLRYINNIGTCCYLIKHFLSKFLILFYAYTGSAHLFGHDIIIRVFLVIVLELLFRVGYFLVYFDLCELFNH